MEKYNQITLVASLFLNFLILATLEGKLDDELPKIIPATGTQDTGTHDTGTHDPALQRKRINITYPN